MFGAPTYTPEIDRHMHPLSFYRKLNSKQWTFFIYLVFFAAFTPKVNLHSYSLISTTESFGPPTSPPWGGEVIGIYAHGFFVQNSIPNNFYLKLSLIWCVILTELSPKFNVFRQSFIMIWNYEVWFPYLLFLIVRKMKLVLLYLGGQVKITVL